MAVIKLTNAAVEKLQPAGIRKEYRDEKIKGLLVRVQPSGKKTYMLNYARGKYITLGDASVLRVSAAREMAIKELGKTAAGKDPLEARKKKRDGTFSEFFRKHYGAYIQENQRGAKQALARYRYLCTQAGSVQLSDFTPFEIAKFQSQ
ncbi:MAG: Arm DNA-binding domain-containing protein [Acidobacteriota bacterium]